MCTSNQPPFASGGEGSKSAFEFNSFVRVDMKKLSQSELYSLSRSSSDAFDLRNAENDVVPNIKSDLRPTGSVATTNTTPRRIFAFSHRRGLRRCISCSDGDALVTENKLILNSLERLVAEGVVYDSNARRDIEVPAVADNHSGVQKRKRKKKKISKNETEFEGFGVINVNNEAIDLKFLACDADDAFESELNRMTVGIVREDEFLGFLNGLDGRWGSSRKRRKYVDATVFVKALPVNWKILLSLRPRVRQPSLYCRRFVSPSDEHFKSCKDVAFYLKSQFATNNANPSEVDPESGARAHRSSHPASKIDLSGTNNNLIRCKICRDSFTSIVGLESHLQKYHGNDNQRLDADTDTLSRKRSVPRGLLLIREPKYPPPIIQNSVKQKTVVKNKDTVTRRNELKNISVNGDGSSSERNNNSEGKGNLKTRCIWCLVEFIREPVDAETLASSCGFICPKCKDHVSWRFERALSELTQHADN